MIDSRALSSLPGPSPATAAPAAGEASAGETAASGGGGSRGDRACSSHGEAAHRLGEGRGIEAMPVASREPGGLGKLAVQAFECLRPLLG